MQCASIAKNDEETTLENEDAKKNDTPKLCSSLPIPKKIDTLITYRCLAATSERVSFPNLGRTSQIHYPLSSVQLLLFPIQHLCANPRPFAAAPSPLPSSLYSLDGTVMRACIGEPDVRSRPARSQRLSVELRLRMPFLGTPPPSLPPITLVAS